MCLRLFGSLIDLFDNVLYINALNIIIMNQLDKLKQERLTFITSAFSKINFAMQY